MSIDLSNHLTHPNTRARRATRAEETNRTRAEAFARNVQMFSSAGGRRDTSKGCDHVLVGQLRELTPAVTSVKSEREQRLDALLPAVRAKASSISLIGLEALNFISHRCRAAGNEPVLVNSLDIARAINTDAETALRALDELHAAGAVRTVRSGLGAALLYPSL